MSYLGPVPPEYTDPNLDAGGVALSRDYAAAQSREQQAQTHVYAAETAAGAAVLMQVLISFGRGFIRGFRGR